MNSQQARYLRQQKRDGNFEENNNVQAQLKNAEKQLSEPTIQNQLDFFGYMLEPFSMKEEREIGKITKEGFFAINKEKEKSASDRWLDSLLTGQEQQLIQEKNKQLAEERLSYKISEQCKEEENSEEFKYKQIERLINLLDDKQQVNQALVQLKSKIPVQDFKLKKNVRKKVKVNDEKEDTEPPKPENLEQLKDKLAQLVSLALYFVEKCDDLDIYKKTKEQLKKELQLQEKIVEESKTLQPIQSKQSKDIEDDDKIFSDVEGEVKEKTEKQNKEMPCKDDDENDDKDNDSESDKEKQESQDQQSSDEEEDSDELDNDYSEDENQKKSLKKSKKQIEDKSNSSSDDVD